MKKNMPHWYLFLLLSLLGSQLLSCKRNSVDGIEFIENPKSVGFEKAVWSPVDPNQLLVTASVSGFLGNSEVYLFNLKDRSTQEIATTSGGDILGEGWSPSGEKIIISSSIDTEGYEDGGIWLWEEGANQLTELMCCKGINAATMVNEDQLVFSPVIGSNKGFASLILLDIDSGEETTISSDLGKGDIYNLSFSQTSNELIFSLWNEGKSSVNIYSFEDDSITKILFSRPEIDDPAWSPNGSVIAFTEPSFDGILLKIMNPDTECEKVIPTTFHAIFNLTWSPDGQKIAVVGNNEIIVIDLAEIFQTKLLSPSFLCE